MSAASPSGQCGSEASRVCTGPGSVRTWERPFERGSRVVLVLSDSKSEGWEKISNIWGVIAKRLKKLEEFRIESSLYRIV